MCKVMFALTRLFTMLLFCTTWFGPVVAIADDEVALLADVVQRGDFEKVDTLLEESSDVNARQADGMTALHWAVFHEKVAVVKTLLDAGAEVDAKNRYGVTPLVIACTSGNADCVAALLDGGADANGATNGGETVLMTAARTGRLDPVKLLVAGGADVNAKERRGQTAMMWAAAEGHTEVVEALIGAGADFTTPLKSGFTPLFFAVRQGHSESALALVEAGADLNEVMQPERRAGRGPVAGMSPFMLAVENGHLELAVALVDSGADPNEDRTGYTALHAITWVRKPIRGDGDPSPIGSGGIDSLQFVRLLVQRGANVNARHGKHTPGGGRLKKSDATPFLLAAETGDVELMKLLLELGADPTLTNVDACTPLLAAAGVGVLGDGDESAGTEQDAIAAIDLLLELGADINAVDKLGNSAMHGAAYKSWSQLIQYLNDRGADAGKWDRKNRLGWTPMMIAEGNRPGNFRPSPETMDALKLDR